MKKTLKNIIIYIFIFTQIFLTVGPNDTVKAVSLEETKISYRAHVQDIGWMNYVNEGSIAGTTGKSLRMEAITINNKNSDFKMKYKVHVQDIGWMDYVDEGSIAGTTGKSLRMEAIKIRIENKNPNITYKVLYRVHVQDIGWMDWVNEGNIAGTTGKSLRMEAIEIKIIKEIKINNEKQYNNGIDVSYYQGDIDWKKVKNSNIDFAIIRAGYRGYGISNDGTNGKLVRDGKFIQNIVGAINSGLDVGVYFFTQAINEKEAIEEADFVLNLVKNYKITYPIAIDTEYSTHPSLNGRADNLSVEERTKVVKAFCDRIEEKGYKTMIYANKWWLNENLDMSKLSNYDVWLAHYTGANQLDPLLKPSNYTGKYNIWQYTDKGAVEGINGNVDMSIEYIKK